MGSRKIDRASEVAARDIAIVPSDSAIRLATGKVFLEDEGMNTNMVPFSIARSPSLLTTLAAFFTTTVAITATTQAQDSLQANNPLASMTSFQAQSDFFGNLSEIDEPGNVLNLRAIRPFDFLGGRWVARATLPIVTLPVGPGFGQRTGVGDVNIFAGRFLDVGDPRITFTLGPNMTASTASDTRLGTGSWNFGVANVLFNAVNPKFQWGYLAVYETDLIKTYNSAQDVSRLFFQPFGVYQFGDGWVLRSTGVWQFDFENNRHAMPVGLGVGKVIITDGSVVNLFFEPRYSVSTRGPGQPEWGAFFGVNVQLR